MKNIIQSLAIRQRKFDVIVFIIIYSLTTSALYQWPLYSLAIATIDKIDIANALALATLFVLQLMLSIVIWSFISLISLRLMQGFSIALLFGNAIALYFIATYGVVLDASMMGNVFNTQPKEASELLQPKLFIYLLLLGLVPGFAITRLTITRKSRIKSLYFLIVTVLIGSLWIYANAKSWLWIDKHAKQFGGLVLPWSYIINSARHFDRSSKPNQTQLLLPDLKIIDPDKTVVILVVGESARAKNFSLLGYVRPTNPLLSKTKIIALPNSHACSTYTTRSLHCMFSHQGNRSPFAVTHETLPTYLHRQGIEVIWRSNNWGEPPIKVSQYVRADDIRKACKGEECGRLTYDEVLLHGLNEILKSSAQKKSLIVLHQTGSHGPQYFKKYPPEFDFFRPTCQTVDLSKCSPQELINAYDNTILYTDFILSRVINMLEALKDTSAVMLYVSDHGESLGEYGLYLHGTPYSIAPNVQKNIPMLLWMSDKFARERNLSGKKINQSIAYSHDYVFHSVMGAMGLTSDIYDSNFDLFRKFE